MGGSLLLALKARNFRGCVAACARSETDRRWALEHGAESACANPGELPRDADLGVLAVPAGAFDACVPPLVRALNSATLITDVASAKRAAIARLARLLGARPYLSSHPMAGSEKSGIAGARANLYEGRKVILTPHSAEARRHVPALTAFWSFLGAKVLVMDPEEHDRAVAWVSHMPHLAIAALVRAAAGEGAKKVDLAGSPLRAAGTGMRDISRLASGNPEMWREIVLENLDEIRAALLGYGAEIENLAGVLERAAHDGGRELADYLMRARGIREEHHLAE